MVFIAKPYRIQAATTDVRPFVQPESGESESEGEGEGEKRCTNMSNE
jgi:hypothetical protein